MLLVATHWHVPCYSDITCQHLPPVFLSYPISINSLEFYLQNVSSVHLLLSISEGSPHPHCLPRRLQISTNWAPCSPVISPLSYFSPVTERIDVTPSSVSQASILTCQVSFHLRIKCQEFTVPHKSVCPGSPYLSDFIPMTVDFLEQARLFPTSGPLVCLLCLDALL